MLGALYRRLQTARWWVKATDLASKREFEKALEYVRLVNGRTAAVHQVGVDKYGVYSGLLEGFLLVELGRSDEALRSLESVQSALGRVKSVTDEIRYLKLYASLLRNDVEAGDAQVEPFPEEYLDVDLNKVPAHVKSNFPLRLHPRWGT